MPGGIESGAGKHFAPAMRSLLSTEDSPHPTMKTASLAALLFFAASASQLTAEVRTWKDATGLHEVKAELLGVAGGMVWLKTADGRTVKLAFAQLSKEDQAFPGQHRCGVWRHRERG